VGAEGSSIVSTTNERGTATEPGSAESGREGAAGARLETRARVRALQALYAWDVRCSAQSKRAQLEMVATDVWDDLGVDPGERRLAARIVTTMAQHAHAIDLELAEVTTNWRLERLGAIERSVLRLAAAEMVGEMAPPRVVIQEAVHLAERYGSAKSAHFVNGVLDALARRTGRL
jgi:transcription antitermination protein NusB